MNLIKETMIFSEWIRKLKDSKARNAILARVNRAKLGNFGDVKSVGSGVSEMRIMIGAGYRVYYTRKGDITYILLCGGDKSTQQKDIDNAIKILEQIK